MSIKLNGICYSCEHFYKQDCKQNYLTVFLDDTQQVSECEKYKKVSKEWIAKWTTSLNSSLESAHLP